jgi:hypothetical protein
MFSYTKAKALFTLMNLVVVVKSNFLAVILPKAAKEVGFDWRNSMLKMGKKWKKKRQKVQKSLKKEGKRRKIEKKVTKRCKKTCKIAQPIQKPLSMLKWVRFCGAKLHSQNEEE